MSWAIGFDHRWNRDIGYGVPAYCDHPGCDKEIDRGLSYVCGGEPRGGDEGCGLYFCGDHMFVALRSHQLCERCFDGGGPFAATPDHPRWIQHKLTDDSWAAWRAEHPEWAKTVKAVAKVVGEPK